MRTLFLLLIGHYVVDFNQSDWVVANKGGGPVWIHVLTAHSMMHGLPVYLVTGSVTLSVAEVIAHWITDFAKSRGYIGFHTDQAIHILCKIVWTLLSNAGI